MKRVILTITAILFTSFCYGKIITLEDSIKELKLLNNEIEIFQDEAHTITLEDIISKGNQVEFKIYGPGEQFSKNTHNVYWMRFKIKDNSGHDKWVLEILDSRFDEVIFYAPDLNDPERYIQSISGITHPFKSRKYEHKNFVFDIPLIEDQKEHYYYLKIKPGVVGSFLFKIRQNNVFASYGFKEHLLLGMYYGILLIMAFYNLFIYFSVKERLYIYYFFYVIAWAFNSTLDDGLGFQYIWSDFPVISQGGVYFARILMLTFYVFYSQSFLDIKTNFPESRSVLYKLLLFYIGCTIFLTYFNLTLVYNLLFTFIFVYILYVSFVIYKKGYKPARFFLLGNSIIVLGLIIYLLKNAAVFNNLIHESPILHTFMVYIRNVIMILDIVILSIALGDRIRYLKRTAEVAQLEIIHQLNEKKLLGEKVNRELEEKVAERTRTIEEKKELLELANSKLQQQAEEINKMNALLDLDNWNLKKNIIQEKEARIVLKDINFEEFSLVYPNDSACYHYLEEIKWEQGYTCRKCGSKKFGKGVTVFSRRCSNCRYDESITAYTVFHRCKFGIQIAMYITVMMNRYGKSIPITDISKEVKMRNATCWKFAQKILLVRETKEYKNVNENDKLKYLILHS
ncbi:MAG: transposase [Cytophagales bacterium]|nr:transposase [Cytophaga sp.]